MLTCHGGLVPVLIGYYHVCHNLATLTDCLPVCVCLCARSLCVIISVCVLHVLIICESVKGNSSCLLIVLDIKFLYLWLL